MPFREDTVRALNRGEDRKSLPHLIPDGFVARARNVRFRDGVPERIGGYEAFLPAGLLANTPIVFAAQHIVGDDRVFVLFTTNGFALLYDEATATTTTLRRLESTGPNGLEEVNWWSSNFGASVIIGDGVNQPWRLLASAAGEAAPANKSILVPLHARQLATFDPDETWTTDSGITDLGGDATTSEFVFRQGIQGHRYRWDGPQADKRIRRTETVDIQTSPYGAAPNIGTADPGEGIIRLHIYVYSGSANYTSGFVQFDDGTESNYRRFALPGTLAPGRNSIEMRFSTSTTNGTPPTTAAARMSISLSTNGTVDLVVDDLQVAYRNGPGLFRTGAIHRGFLFGVADSVPYRVAFSNAINPSYFTPTDVLDVFGQTPVDKRVEDTNLYSFFDTLLVGTRNTVFGVTGFDRTTFVISEQSAGQGMAVGGIVPFADSFLYAFQNRLYAYSAAQLQAISSPEDPLLVGLDESVPIFGVRWPQWDTMWFAIKLRDGTRTILAYDYGSGARAWATHDIPARQIYPYVSTTGVPTLMTLHTDGRLYLQDRGGTFGGASFTSEIVTKFFGVETSRNIRKWWDATLLAFYNPDTTMTFQFRVADDPSQFDNAAWSAPFTLDATSLAEGLRPPIGERGRFCQLRFQYSTSTTVHFHLYPDVADPYMLFGTTEAGASSGPLLQNWRLVPPLVLRSVLTPARA